MTTAHPLTSAPSATAPTDAAITESDVRANGLSIGVTAQGRGAPLLLLHGAEADRTMFTALAAQLAAHFTVIAYDQRDSGRTVDLHSETHGEPPRAYQLADLADDAAALIEALGYLRVHVLGTSLGGHIAQVLAARHPRRLDKLILGSTWPAGQGLGVVNPDTARQLMTWRADPLAHQRDIAGLFFPDDYLAAHPEAVARFGASQRTAEQSARRATLLGTPYPIGAGQIQADTLLLMGNADRLVPNAATLSISETLARPQTHRLAGVGHIFALQAPAAAAEVITAFLQPPQH